MVLFSCVNFPLETQSNTLQRKTNKHHHDGNVCTRMRNARAVGIQRGIFVANTNNPEMRQGEISRKSATVALYHHDQQYLSMDHVWCVEK